MVFRRFIEPVHPTKHTRAALLSSLTDIIPSYWTSICSTYDYFSTSKAALTNMDKLSHQLKKTGNNNKTKQIIMQPYAYCKRNIANPYLMNMHKCRPC